jgi:hypothetical protein
VILGICSRNVVGIHIVYTRPDEQKRNGHA